jgi:hypothetical protein
VHDPLLDSAGHALAAFDTDDDLFAEPAAHAVRHVVQPIFEPEQSSSFTLAGIPSDSLDLEFPPAAPAEPTAASRPPRKPRASAYGEPAIPGEAPVALPSLYGAPVEDYELEHALEALDVDLDDLSIPHAATQLARDRDPPRSRAAPAERQAPYAPGGRTPASTPSRAVRHPAADPAGSGAGRVVSPRITTDDGVVIDFDEDD